MYFISSRKGWLRKTWHALTVIHLPLALQQNRTTRVRGRVSQSSWTLTGPQESPHLTESKSSAPAAQVPYPTAVFPTPEPLRVFPNAAEMCYTIIRLVSNDQPVPFIIPFLPRLNCYSYLTRVFLIFCRWHRWQTRHCSWASRKQINQGRDESTPNAHCVQFQSQTY